MRFRRRDGSERFPSNIVISADWVDDDPLTPASGMDSSGNAGALDASTNDWGAPFADDHVISSQAVSDVWPGGHVDVIENAPPHPDYVRTEQGAYHGLILATDRAEGEDRLQAGSVHFDTTQPGDLHIYSRARNEQPHLSRWYSPLSLISVRVAPSTVAKACRAANRDYDATTFVDRFGADDPFLRQLVVQLGQTLRAAATQHAPHGMYVEQLMQALAAHLVQHHTAPRSAPIGETDISSGLPPDRLRRVKDYVDAHLGQDIALEDLAAVACYSEYHFCRAFKQSTGQSPYQYVIRRRMNEAGRQLRAHPHRSVAAVAQAVGYASRSHFSRQFKKHHGLAPSQWKKEAQR